MNREKENLPSGVTEFVPAGGSACCGGYMRKSDHDGIWYAAVVRQFLKAAVNSKASWKN